MSDRAFELQQLSRYKSRRLGSAPLPSVADDR